MSYCIPDAPDISRALRTGHYATVEYYETDQVYYLTEEGEMDAAQVAEYMMDYIRTNLDDAAELFGIDRRVRKVLCDGDGVPYE